MTPCLQCQAPVLTFFYYDESRAGKYYAVKRRHSVQLPVPRNFDITRPIYRLPDQYHSHDRATGPFCSWYCADNFALELAAMARRLIQ